MSEIAYTLLAVTDEGYSCKVKFIFKDDSMRVLCGCVAGSLDRMCKHKNAFLNNDATMLYDKSEKELFETVCELVGKSNYSAEAAKYQKAVDEIESRKRELTAQAKRIKEAFGRRLSEGI